MIINRSEIKRLLAKKGISITQVSQMIDVDRQKLANWLHRGKIPDSHIDKYNELSSILNMNNELATSLITEVSEEIPYYDIDVAAGNSSMFGELLSQEPDGYYKIPGLNSGMVVNVFGDSMATKITPGSKIAISKVNDYSFFNFGAIHVVVTKEQRLLKYLRRHDDPDMFLLLSENNEYDPIDIPKKSVLELWILDKVLWSARD